MVTIAVDAMGGDNAPKAEVEGAVRAVKSLAVEVILVGKEDVVRKELSAYDDWRSLPIRIHHASEVITMEESAAKAMRSKKDSSIRVASRLVREGIAQGVVSAGNTGAAMATAKMVQGMVPGVERPALASVFPTLKGTPAVMVDVGANVDSTPVMLAQFAVMGEIYSRVIFHTQRPKVGILSIGEEEQKGNELTRAATPLLKKLPLDFIGNVEGRDVYTGIVDVIVCDGFIGNVALKVSEGLVEVITSMLKESLNATITRQMGYLLSRTAFVDFKKRLDYSEYGGAPLLGVKGVCIICHGRSNANAIKNAIRVAREFAIAGVNARIEEELRHSALGSAAAAE
ncbi:MAG: phosphate acyltransferase PlsX [Candidatus Solibacter usitatus]|nr:phosphate acyltransferase PlsX [Candidatus Solibacter usitatus]